MNSLEETFSLWLSLLACLSAEDSCLDLSRIKDVTLWCWLNFVDKKPVLILNFNSLFFHLPYVTCLHVITPTNLTLWNCLNLSNKNFHVNLLNCLSLILVNFSFKLKRHRILELFDFFIIIIFNFCLAFFFRSRILFA